MTSDENDLSSKAAKTKRTNVRKAKATKVKPSFLKKNEWYFESLFQRGNSVLEAAFLWELDRSLGADQVPFLSLSRSEQNKLAKKVERPPSVRTTAARVHPAIKEKGRGVLAGAGRTGHFLVINFDGYKRNEIVNAFSKWLEVCESYLVAEGRMKRVKIGRPVSFSSKLRDLGVYRLDKSGIKFTDYRKKAESFAAENGAPPNPYHLTSQKWYDAKHDAEKELANYKEEREYPQALLSTVQPDGRHCEATPGSMDEFDYHFRNVTWRELIMIVSSDLINPNCDTLDERLKECFGITSNELDEPISATAIQTYFTQLVWNLPSVIAR
jgi:hypothetical protein